MYPSLSILVPISSLLSLYFLYFHHFPSFSLHLLSLLVTSMFVFPFLFYSRALHPLLFFRFILLGSFHLSLSLSLIILIPLSLSLFSPSHSPFFILSSLQLFYQHPLSLRWYPYSSLRLLFHTYIYFSFSFPPQEKEEKEGEGGLSKSFAKEEGRRNKKREGGKSGRTEKGWRYTSRTGEGWEKEKRGWGESAFFPFNPDPPDTFPCAAHQLPSFSLSICGTRPPLAVPPPRPISPTRDAANPECCDSVVRLAPSCRRRSARVHSSRAHPSSLKASACRASAITPIFQLRPSIRHASSLPSSTLSLDPRRLINHSSSFFFDRSLFSCKKKESSLLVSLENPRLLLAGNIQSEIEAAWGFSRERRVPGVSRHSILRWEKN